MQLRARHSPPGPLVPPTVECLCLELVAQDRQTQKEASAFQPWIIDSFQSH